MPCFQKLAEKKKVPDKCPYCGNRIVENHCFACEGKGTITEEQEKVVYT